MRIFPFRLLLSVLVRSSHPRPQSAPLAISAPWTLSPAVHLLDVTPGDNLLMRGRRARTPERYRVLATGKWGRGVLGCEDDSLREGDGHWRYEVRPEYSLAQFRPLSGTGRTTGIRVGESVAAEAHQCAPDAVNRTKGGGHHHCKLLIYNDLECCHTMRFASGIGRLRRLDRLMKTSCACCSDVTYRLSKWHRALWRQAPGPPGPP